MILTCFLKVIELKTPFLVKTVYPYLIITSILEDLYNKKNVWDCLQQDKHFLLNDVFQTTLRFKIIKQNRSFKQNIYAQREYVNRKNVLLL